MPRFAVSDVQVFVFLRLGNHRSEWQTLTILLRAMHRTLHKFLVAIPALVVHRCCGYGRDSIFHAHQHRNRCAVHQPGSATGLISGSHTAVISSLRHLPKNPGQCLNTVMCCGCFQRNHALFAIHHLHKRDPWNLP